MRRMTIILCLLLIAGIVSAEELSERKIRYKGDSSASCFAIIQKNSEGYAASVETSHGMIFKNGIFWGLGTGIMWSFTNSEAFVPVFTEARYYLDCKKVKPFFAAKIGGIFCTDRPDNAFFASPVIGLSVKSIQLKLGYQYNLGIATIRDNVGGGKP
ncbi:MAG: hypothetical protein ACI4TU_04805 [Candidatus Cryptobacteroides sp.]